MTNNKLLSRIVGNSTVKSAAVLKESKFLTQVTQTPTVVYGFNVAMSGTLHGGFSSGITGFAGESKTFKTASCLTAMKAYMDAHPDAVGIYYDSEFGTTPGYVSAAGIDTARVLHVPVLHIEQLKFDLVKQLSGLNRGDKVFVMIDSIGNIASKKELDDTLAEKSTADMTRAKQIKSMFRMVTPMVKTLDIPLFAIFHVYKSQDLYPTDIVSGGTGGTYAADTMIIVGKRKVKDAEGELEGFQFVYRINKSRFVREGSEVPITVTFEDGVQRYSGLLELALESGHVVKPSNGWYSRAQVDASTGELVPESKKWRRAETDTDEFWQPLIKDATFSQWVAQQYQLSYASAAKAESVAQGKAK